MYLQSDQFFFYFRSECTVTLTNVSDQPIELLEITMQSMLDPDIQAQTFQWSKDNLMAQLPIKPHSSASFTLYIHATADFLSPGTDGNFGVYYFYCQFFLFRHFQLLVEFILMRNNLF